jgi:hypothetical protein
MKLHHKPEPDGNFRPINSFRAALLRVWGPADSWDNPLAGTKYDPKLRAQRQHDSLEHRQERWEHRKQHFDELLHGHHEDEGAPPRPEHPDE